MKEVDSSEPVRIPVSMKIARKIMEAGFPLQIYWIYDSL